VASPSVTYTFANSTTADATQVNTNFTDLINAMSDGTKDFSISALTCAGTATLNGNVNIGNASGDDLTILASLASTLPIKTNNSFNIGSATLGLAGAYFGAAGGFTTKIAAAATSSWTFTLPPTAGTDGYNLTNSGSGATVWQPPVGISNIGASVTVGTNALTVALKGADGNDPSATNPVYIPFRSATSTTGTPVFRKVTSALSVVVSSGSTLGHTSGVDQYAYGYFIDNAGTVELAISGASFDDGSIVSTTAEGGAGGADTGGIMYSTSARSNVASRKWLRIKSNQVTAGTWAAAVLEVSLAPFASLNEVVWLTDEKANQTDGGTFTSGSYQTRTLNTVRNPKPWVSLVSNQFILQPGSYRIRAEAPAQAVNRHKAKLRNITDSTDDIIGTAEMNDTAANQRGFSKIVGQITITAAKTYEIQHRGQTTASTTGFGSASNWTGEVEVYTLVEIERLN
jgi:hypothetical protein